MKKLEISIGSRFGNWEVLRESERKITPLGQTNRVFECRCICGKTKEIRLLHLNRNSINSCGCRRFGVKRVSDEDIYIRKIWRAIKYRTQQNYVESHLYFDKGVCVCDEWLNNYDSFRLWAIDNGLKKANEDDI